jgi:nucleotide-binding universal stress UspA family protein
MRYSDKPVVVVPPTAPPPKESAELLSRMLVPIDPGAEDASTAAFAIALARGTQRQIIFCAVVDESRIVSLTAEVQGGYVLPDLLTEVRLGAQQVIDAAIAQARVRGIVAEGYVVSGEPIAAICKLAGEKTGTAIVMGTHGRLGLSRMFIGSTTQGVLRAAQIPVVTLLLRHDKCAADPAIDPAAEAVDRKLIST